MVYVLHSISHWQISEICTNPHGLIKEVKSLGCKKCKVAYNKIDKAMANKTQVSKKGKTTYILS